MSKSTVHVKNIASATSDKEIKDFFSFCGKITDISVSGSGETKEADVTFEKETAAKTALLLNNTQLGSTHITVASASGDHEDDGSHFSKSGGAGDSDEIHQEDKPRARILAEYLAQGYVVGDAALQRALDLDKQHGVSARFFGTLQNLDQKYHATDRAKATDTSYGITAKANSLWSGIGSYFEKAANTPSGQRIVKFYEEGSRQVQDVHAEARRLADLKKEQHGGSAYKAAGLEKVFGKEKEPAAGAAGSATTATGDNLGTQSSTQPAPTAGVPAVKPLDEAKST